ncbi:hypothetical protein HMPREF0091_10288 [Fannyhessea vaginae DSM 15829]|uniref:Secreted protein n=1 Tax=Fannyhessea vaginae DSM 15829 TaxID=525256 RepID=F1T3P7_9ACTN|nr:hypothetical protein HMPREF0091_10288 [Fannyhessea vaginae DSM 15829]
MSWFISSCTFCLLLVVPCCKECRFACCWPFLAASKTVLAAVTALSPFSTSRAEI